MDPQDYQHACERAELLGLPKPSEEEWRRTMQSENRCTNDDDDDDDNALQVISEKNSRIVREKNAYSTSDQSRDFSLLLSFRRWARSVGNWKFA